MPKNKYLVYYGLFTDSDLKGICIGEFTNYNKAKFAQKEYIKDKINCFTYIQKL